MPRIQHKRGTSANLASVNPTPLAGELVWDSSENAIKIGDGATAWTSLAYVTATPRSHTHTMANISDISVEPAGSPPRTWDVALTFNYATSSWVAKGIGNVGIGSQPLGGWPSGSVGAELAGKAPAASPAFTGNATFEASSGVPVTITNTGTGNSFVVNDAAGDTTPFVVNASGAVGIGISAPNAPLNVIAESSSTGAKLQTWAYTAAGNENFNLRLTQAVTAGIVQWVFNQTNNATDYPSVMCFDRGNVGINKTSPASRLDVNGVITVAATSGSAGSYLPSVTFSGDANTGFGQVSGQSDSASVFTAGHERVRVKSTGAVRFVPLSADPASGEAGDVYYNSATNKLRVYNGTSWIDLH